MNDVGFTGSRHGMNEEQSGAVAAVLYLLGATRAHHGDCIGADSDFHQLVSSELGIDIVIHPPTDPRLRAFCIRRAPRAGQIVTELPPKPYLDRNRDIVDDSDVLIATPAEYDDPGKGGTWYTIRYAASKGVRLYTIYPDGSGGQS